MLLNKEKHCILVISRWPLEQLKQAYNYLAERDVKVLTVQDRLNLLDRKPQNEGILSFCREVGAGFVSFSPLAQGLLTNKYLNGVTSTFTNGTEPFLAKEGTYSRATCLSKTPQLTCFRQTRVAC